jgi:hypothetical protein
MGYGLNIDLYSGRASTDSYFGGLVGISGSMGLGISDGSIATTSSSVNKRSIVLGGSALFYGKNYDITGTIWDPKIEDTDSISASPVSPKVGYTLAYQAIRKYQKPVNLNPYALSFLRFLLCK